MDKNQFKKALELIKKYDSIIIHRHTHPDGDAVGSQVGLRYLIKDNFPSKMVYITGDDPSKFSFIEGSKVDSIDDSLFKSSLSVILDSSSEDVVSDTRYKNAKETLRFDHHIFSGKFCSVEVVDEKAESTCGLITEFATSSSFKFSPFSASALYTGIVTDSGRFLYDDVTPSTFLRASLLLKEGIDTQKIYNALYKSSFESLKIKADFISRIKIDSAIAYIYNSSEDVLRNGGDPYYLSRAMVNVMSGIEGVEVWVNFTECIDGILAEFRSDYVDVQKIALSYGGGGHIKASGALIKNKKDIPLILESLKELTKGGSSN